MYLKIKLSYFFSLNIVRAGSSNINYIKGFFDIQSWPTFGIKEDKRNVPQVASSIKFLADLSSK